MFAAGLEIQKMLVASQQNGEAFSIGSKEMADRREDLKKMLINEGLKEEEKSKKDSNDSPEIVSDIKHIKLVNKKEDTKEEGEVGNEVNIKQNSEYHENSWPSGEEKEGYTFGGKKVIFTQAIKEIKKLFFSYKEHELDDMKFSLGKKKPIKNGDEFLVKVKKGTDEAGAAVLKIYNPNNKKGSTIVINKSKENDVKFVKVLAINVIKNLIDKFISKEGWSKLKSINVINCEKCDKLFSAERYLKAHMANKHKETSFNCAECNIMLQTKDILMKHMQEMHKAKKNHITDIQELSFECHECRKSFQSNVNLKDHIEKEHTKLGFECHECKSSFQTDVNLKDHKEVDHSRGGFECQECKGEFKTKLEIKKHIEIDHIKQSRACDECDMVFEEMVIKDWLLKVHQHKITDCAYRTEHLMTVDFKCDVCDTFLKTNSDLERHLRSVHGQESPSLSPVQKKMRLSETEEIEESDVMETEDVLSENLENMKLQEEDDILKKRSNEMDKKVIEKRKTLEEKENEFQAKKREEEKKQKYEDQKKRKRHNLRSTRETNRRTIENGKDNAKEMKKVKFSKEVIEAEKVKENVREKVKEKKYPSGVTEIDPKYHHLVDDHIVRVASASNGTCQATSKSIILFNDPMAGRELARIENLYLIAHWEHFEKSFSFPHTAKIGGGQTKKFDDDISFLAWLATNPDAIYMWGDHQQLQITANRYQVRINVLTVDSKGEGTVLRTPISPNPELKEFAKLPEDANVQDIWLQYTNGNHYDALLKKNSSFLSQGTLQEIEKTDEEEKELTKQNENKEKPAEREEAKIVQNENDSPKNSEMVIKDLKKKLKQVEDGKNALEIIYRRSEETVKKLEEEKDILKIEVKDLKEYIGKSVELSDQVVIAHVQDNKKNCKFFWKDKSTQSYTCQEMKEVRQMCRKTFQEKGELDKHIKKDHKKYFLCDECDFQGHNVNVLTKHINLKHKTKSNQIVNRFSCTDCSEQFSDHWNLMNHIKVKHEEKRELCKHYNKGHCSFSYNECWFLHEKTSTSTQSVKRIESKESEEHECYMCHNKFNTKSGMMRHRQQLHPEGLRECREDLDGNCSHGDVRCWYKHKSSERNQDFHEVSENLAPPANA